MYGFRSLREFYPEATLDFLVEEYSAVAARGLPWVDEVVEIPRKPGLLGSLRILGDLRQRGYDLVVDSQSNQKTGLFTWLSAASLPSPRVP